jgi:hypothetical protein
MLRPVILLALLFQSAPDVRPTIIAKASEPPRRNFSIIYYDDSFLFAARHYGDSREAGDTEPGLFVHSKQHSRWIQILQISTAGGRFGKSQSDDPEAQKKLRFASVGWDFTHYAQRPYIDQPLKTSGSIAFPDRVGYDSSTDRYELRYFSTWGVERAETVLYVSRRDLVKSFLGKGN